MLSIKPYALMLLAKYAMLGEALFNQRTDSRFSCSVTLRHRIETSGQFVDDGDSGAKPRQRLTLGGIGKRIEKNAVRQHRQILELSRENMLRRQDNFFIGPLAAKENRFRCQPLNQKAQK
ncbi:hypothetical protein D3C80_426030 [compost metagenome]